MTADCREMIRSLGTPFDLGGLPRTCWDADAKQLPENVGDNPWPNEEFRPTGWGREVLRESDSWALWLTMTE